MPAKDGAAAPRNRAPRYRRPAPDRVRAAARALLSGGRRRFGSQRELRRALVAELREDDPLFSVGGARMRRLLIGTPGVRVRVRYSERNSRAPVASCPVCAGEVRPIRNRTLDGDRVVLGYACRNCAYWTHLKRRVPVRYEFVGGRRP